MASIYQKIWNADQSENGLEAILSSDGRAPENGFVRVNAEMNQNSEEALKVLTEVHIPDSKISTYELCLKLFNNYALAEPAKEVETAEERLEVHEFVDAIIDSGPMEVARQYIESQTGTKLSRERWYNTVFEMWFRPFSSGGDPELTGFEHVVVGEQEGAKVQGYHFWWKYYLDDGFASLVDDGIPSFPGLDNDRIHYGGSKQQDPQLNFPESVTISYRWMAPDYEAKAVRPLYKKIGGFFVGCSVEGLMAMGTVRGHKGANAPRVATIEGAIYDMKLFHSPNGQHIRTFYPIFSGKADLVDAGDRSQTSSPVGAPKTNEVDSPVRIAAAMVNPKGEDQGFESVTLANTSTTAVLLEKWTLIDRNGTFDELEYLSIESGEFLTIKLSGNNVQLSNKGGEITLKDYNDEIVHKVSYSKLQASRQGTTILF